MTEEQQAAAGAPSAPTGPADAAVSRDPGTPDTAPDDADDLRGFHFRRLIRKRATLYAGVIPTVVIAIALGIVGNPLWLAIIPIFGGLVIVIVCWLIAMSRSEVAFFEAYSKQRGLTRTQKGQLGGYTPLLCKGDERQAEEIMEGPLAEDAQGTLALYTYTEVYYDKDGRHETDYHFTVAMTSVPECSKRMPELYANRKFGFRIFEKVEDAFRSKERVKLESEKLDEEYEIFANKDQDPNVLRQLFSPTFIVWMTDEAPEKFAFELVDGTLCCNVKGHKKSAVELDGMRKASAAVARRLRAEAAEGSAASAAS